MNLSQLVVVSASWEDLYSGTQSPALPSHRHPPSTSRGFRNVQQQFLTVHLTFYLPGPLLNICIFDTFSSSIHTHCSLHLGAIPPSYISQIPGVIVERWFVLVPLHGSGKRARKTAQASLHPIFFPVLHFLL